MACQCNTGSVDTLPCIEKVHNAMSSPGPGHQSTPVVIGVVLEVFTRVIFGIRSGIDQSDIAAPDSNLCPPSVIPLGHENRKRSLSGWCKHLKCDLHAAVLTEPELDQLDGNPILHPLLQHINLHIPGRLRKSP